MTRTLALVLVAVLPLIGCDPSGNANNSAASSDTEDAGATPREKQFLKVGRRFAEAVVKKDYAAAHAMFSERVTPQMSADDLALAIEQAHREYFTPHHAGEPFVAETEPLALAGQVDTTQDKTGQAIDRISIERYVGDVPDTIPIDIRRASVAVPLFDDEAEERACYLTFLLVEENGELKVGHYFFRWHDMLD